MPERLWSANLLIGSSAEQLAYSFVPVLVPIVAIPWGYVLTTFVGSPRRGINVAARRIDPSALA